MYNAYFATDGAPTKITSVKAPTLFFVASDGNHAGHSNYFDHMNRNMLNYYTSIGKPDYIWRDWEHGDRTNILLADGHVETTEVNDFDKRYTSEPGQTKPVPIPR